MLEQHLVILLVKLAVAASLASILVRSGAFVRMILREERTVRQRLQLAAIFATIFGAGVAARVMTRNNYQAVDLGLEGSLLAGVLGGYITGLLAGVLIALPALFGGEPLTVLLFAGVGTLGGLLRDVAPSTDEIWRFSPIPDLNPYRLIRGQTDYQRLLFQVFFFLAILSCELLRSALYGLSNAKLLFSLQANWPDPGRLTVGALYVSTVFAVSLPLKIWNNTRNEKKLEAHERLLNEARLRALTSQINPHFMFNTLNSVSSLIRTDPDKARAVVYRLSSILRRLLKKHDNLNPLRDELAFIEDYLSIEIVRFGEKLHFIKEVEPDTLDCPVPSMILQPLVENSIRHGLSSKVGGGMIRLRCRMTEGRLQLVVEDDGVGIPEAKLTALFEHGIGISNVNERLKVIYGDTYRMSVDSKPGEGTRTQIEIPGEPAGLRAAS